MIDYNFENFTSVIQKNGKIVGEIPDQFLQQCKNAYLIYFGRDKIVMISPEVHNEYSQYWRKRSKPGRLMHQNVSRLTSDFQVESIEDFCQGVWFIFNFYQYNLYGAEKIKVEIETCDRLLSEPETAGQHIEIRLIEVMDK